MRPLAVRSVLLALSALAALPALPALSATPSVGPLPAFEEDLVLDPTGTDAEFGRVCDVAVAPDGTVFVGDWGFQRIHAFDDDGTHLVSFGQAGEAPGDLPPNPFVLSIDDEGTLVVGGMRHFLAWLAADGQPIRTVDREDGSHWTRDVEFLAGGRIALTYAFLWGDDADADPLMVHVLAADGSHETSFATSTFWNDDLSPHLASSIVRGRATAAADGETLVFVQSQPFELRRYTADGTQLARTREGVGPFLHDVSLPEVDGVTTTVRFTAEAGKPLLLPDGRILVYAWRVHPDDLDREDLDEKPRIERRLYVYDAELRPLGHVESPGWPLTVDPEGRLWTLALGRETPALVRHRVVTD